MQLEQIAELIDSQVSPDELVANMEAVQAIDRQFTFPAFMSSARMVAGKLAGWGLESRVLEQPADGVTKSGDWTMPLAWDCHEATLDLVTPEGALQETLCRRSEDPCCVAMWSAPTPANGITAKLLGPISRDPSAPRGETRLLLGSGSSARPVAPDELAGRVIFLANDPRHLKGALAGYGVAGVVTAFSPAAGYLPQNRFWINGWSDSPDGWAFTAADTPMWCFVLTPAQGTALETRLAAGPVTVRARVESRIYEGVLPAATGVLPGSGEEEILTLGHQFEIGSDDNASGCAVMLEAARVLSSLIAEGRLPRPSRSLRWLFVSECYGSLAWALSEEQPGRRTLAALNLDCVGVNQRLGNMPMPVALTPAGNPSVADTLIRRLCSGYLWKRDPFFSWYTVPFSPCDSTLSDPMIGIPTVYLGGKDRFWHTTADTMDKIDPQAAARATVLAASYAYFLASAGSQEAMQLAEESAADGRRRLARLSCGAAERLRTAEAAELGALLAAGIERLDHWSEVTAERVRSAQRFAEQTERREFRSALRPLVAHVKKTARLEETHLRRVAADRAHELDVPAPTVGPAQPAGWLAKAAQLVPVRRVPGTITLDDVPDDQRRGCSNPRWSTTLTNVLFRCDGRRSLAEAVRLGLLDSGETAIAKLESYDFLELFRMLEKHGRVELRPARRRLSPPAANPAQG